MKKLSQKGFEIVEVLLLIVVVGIIVGAGYYVYQSQQKTKQSLDNANQNIETIAKSKEEVKEAEQPPQASLEIKEMGIKMTFDEAKQVTYQMNGGECSLAITDTKCVKSAKFVFVDKDLEKKCGGVGVGVFEFNTQPDTISSTKVGDKYYSIAGAPGNCDDDASAKARHEITESLADAKISAL